MSDVPNPRPVDSDGDRPAAGTSSDREFGQLIVDSLVRFFGSAEGDQRIEHRLANSKTVISFHATDAEPLGFTIHMKDEHVQAQPEVQQDSEVHVYGPVDVLADVFLGRRHMGLSIAKGELTYKGPVRKFLRAVPMMRKLDVSQLKDLAAAARERSSDSDNGAGPQ